MYFNISISKRNKDKKEMILKAKSPEDLEKQTDKIKNYLFPDEKREDLICDISQFNNSFSNTNEKYYKIEVTKRAINEGPQEPSDPEYCDYIESALNLEDALSKVKKELEGYGEDSNGFEIYITALSVENCITKELEELKREIRDQYINNHYDVQSMPAGEYFEKMRSLDGQNGDFYQAIMEFNRRLRVAKHIRRIAGYDSLTVKEYGMFIAQLLCADDENGFNSVIGKIKAKLRQGLR